jgi:hypothetical protein
MPECLGPDQLPVASNAGKTPTVSLEWAWWKTNLPENLEWWEDLWLLKGSPGRIISEDP